MRTIAPRMESVVRLLRALIVIKYDKCIALLCRVERLEFQFSYPRLDSRCERWVLRKRQAD
jgi:hypothetical protein